MSTNLKPVLCHEDLMDHLSNRGFIKAMKKITEHYIKKGFIGDDLAIVKSKLDTVRVETANFSNLSLYREDKSLFMVKSVVRHIRSYGVMKSFLELCITPVKGIAYHGLKHDIHIVLSEANEKNYRDLIGFQVSMSSEGKITHARKHLSDMQVKDYTFGLLRPDFYSKDKCRAMEFKSFAIVEGLLISEYAFEKPDSVYGKQGRAKGAMDPTNSDGVIHDNSDL